MTGAPDRPCGPYTIDDLDALPDEGVRRELVNGWILAAPWPSTFHDHAAKIMERALDDAAAATSADVYIEGPLDVDTGRSVRVPDIVVVEGAGARAARARKARAYDAADVLLVVEIVSPRGGSELHGGKSVDYAQVGIPQYWLIDLEPRPSITVRRLGRDGEIPRHGRRVRGDATGDR